MTEGVTTNTGLTVQRTIDAPDERMREAWVESERKRLNAVIDMTDTNGKKTREEPR